MKRSTKISVAFAAAAMTGLLAGASTARAADPIGSGNGSSSVSRSTDGASLAGVKASVYDSPTTSKSSCKGENACKGKGGCKTGDNGCKGKNSCKGKGGCKAADAGKDAGKGTAKDTGKSSCKGKNGCEGT